MKTPFKIVTLAALWSLLSLFVAAPQVVPAVHASAPAAGGGSFQFVSSEVTGARFPGPNGVFMLEQTIDVTGTLAGSMTCDQRQIVHSTGTATFDNDCTFTGSIDGHAGAAIVRIEGTIAADGTSRGRFVIVAGGGGLSGLHGSGTLFSPSGADVGTYVGRFLFAP